MPSRYRENDVSAETGIPDAKLMAEDMSQPLQLLPQTAFGEVVGRISSICVEDLVVWLIALLRLYKWLLINT